MSIIQTSLVNSDASFTNLVVQKNLVAGKDLYVNGPIVSVQNVSANVVAPSIMIINENSIADFVNNIPLDLNNVVELTVDKFKMQSPFVYDGVTDAVGVRNDFATSNFLGFSTGSSIDGIGQSIIMTGAGNVISQTTPNTGPHGIYNASNSSIEGTGRFDVILNGNNHFINSDGTSFSSILGGENITIQNGCRYVSTVNGTGHSIQTSNYSFVGAGRNLSMTNASFGCNLCGEDNVMTGGDRSCNLNGHDNRIGIGAFDCVSCGQRSKVLHANCVGVGLNPSADTSTTAESQFVIGFDSTAASRGMYWINHPTGTGTQLSITGSGQLVEETSSAKFKTNIEPLTFEKATNILGSMESVSYQRIDNGLDDVGLIAEEVAKVFPEAVVFSPENEPRSVRVLPLISVILKVVKDLVEKQAISNQ